MAVVVDVAYGDAGCLSFIADITAGGILETALAVVEK